MYDIKKLHLRRRGKPTFGTTTITFKYNRKKDEIFEITMRVFGPTNGRVDRRYRLAATELGGRGNKEVYTCHIETEGSEKEGAMRK